MEYYLRGITADDKDFIYEVKKLSIFEYVDKIWGWDEEYQIKDFENDFDNYIFKIIVVDEKDVGFIQIDESIDSINIIEIHIIPEYQGKGIGSSILKNIIERANNISKIVKIGCFKDNIRARNLYERLGFKVVKTTDTHYMMEYNDKHM